MKIQTIIIIISTAISAYLAAKLTDQENLDRLNNCGKEDVDDPKSWFWLSPWPEKNDFAVTSLISPRHFLTSSVVLLNHEAQWRKNSKKVDCKNGTLLNIEVPAPMLSDISIIKFECKTHQNPRCEKYFKVKPIGAFLPRICDKNVRDYAFTNGFSPLIVEVDRPVFAPDLKGYRCLSDETMSLEIGDKVLYNGYRYKEESTILELFELDLNISALYPKEFTTSHFNALTGSYGSPLFKLENGKSTIIGMGTMDLMVVDDHKRNKFLRLDYYQDEICLMTGICGRKLATTTNPTTTTNTTTSEFCTSSETESTPETSTKSPLTNVTSSEPPLTSTVSNETLTSEEMEEIPYIYDENVFKEIVNPKKLEMNMDFKDTKEELLNGNTVKGKLELLMVLVVLRFFC